MLLRKQGKKQKGSMITEVLITTLLIVIAMLAVIPMLAIGVKSGAVSKGRTVEMHVAQERIEAFNSEKFDNIYAYLEGKLNEDTFKSLKKGERTEEESDIIYINPSNGKKIMYEDASDHGALLRNGYKKVSIKTSYNYLRGSFEEPHDQDPHPLDDAIQVSIKVVPNGVAGAANKPVLMSATISRDRF